MDRRRQTYASPVNRQRSGYELSAKNITLEPFFMQGIRFFQKVVLICNGCFVIAWILRILPGEAGIPAVLVKTVVVLGFLMALPLNLLLNLLIAVLLLSGRYSLREGGITIYIINLIFLFLTVIYFLIP